MFDKVFISYAVEDASKAKEVYQFLQMNDYVPWMDKENLLPGQNWDFILQKELRMADFIILLISNNSISKRGYVQREFKLALEYCEEKLDSDIYTIPIVLDNCQIPENLVKYQCLPFDSQKSLDKLCRALNFQRKVLLREKGKMNARLENMGYEEKTLKGEYGEKKPRQKFEITYPVFLDSSAESLNELNIEISARINEVKFQARDQYFNDLFSYQEDDVLGSFDSELMEKIQIRHLSREFISLSSFSFMYFPGALHGNYVTAGFHYILNPLRRFHLFQQFDFLDQSLERLSPVVTKRLIEKNENNHFLTEDLGPEESNFQNHYFTDSGLVFVYNPYEIGPYAAGDSHILISYLELTELLPKEVRFLKFIQSTFLKHM